MLEQRRRAGMPLLDAAVATALEDAPPRRGRRSHAELSSEASRLSLSQSSAVISRPITQPERLVRYAADAVILCRHGTAEPMAVPMAVLERLDLQLDMQKTRVVDAPEQGFDVLGFPIAWRTSHRSGKGYPHIELPKRAEC